MSLRPGELLGLPPGFPDVVSSVAFLRYVMIALGGLWAVLLARGQTRGLLGGILFVEAGLAFWVLALGRPYGLLVDPVVTRRAAEISVVAASGNAAETFLAGEPGKGLWVGLARMGLPERVLLLAPTLLPLLVLPALAVVIRTLWTLRDRAPLAALLWLAFSTGDLETLRGMGFIPGLWARPEASVTLVLLLALVLAAARALRGRAGWGLVGLVPLLVLARALLEATERALGPVDALLLLTLDQGAWFVLALLGLRRAGGAAHALLLGGALLVATHVLGLQTDPWCGHALYRLGLVLAASGPVADLARKAGEVLVRIRPLASLEPLQAGTAAILVLLLPGSFLTWWDPPHLDAVAKASLDPLSRPVTEAMAWIRRETPPEAVFLASPDYAPSVAVLGGRRVLRAPTLAVAGDEERRARAEGAILSGREPGPLARRYGLTHVFIAPGEFRSHGLRAPEDLETRGRFRLRYSDPDGLRVYEIRVE